MEVEAIHHRQIDIAVTVEVAVVVEFPGVLTIVVCMVIDVKFCKVNSAENLLKFLTFVQCLLLAYLLLLHGKT